MADTLFKRSTRILVLVVATLLLAASLSAQAKPSNKWRLEFSGGADSDGTGENHVAKDVVKGLKAQLPEDGYHVERDDGEDVLIKKRHGAADFDVEVVSNTVKGVRIHPDRE
jgi:hypothetical protein